MLPIGLSTYLQVCAVHTADAYVGRYSYTVGVAWAFKSTVTALPLSFPLHLNTPFEFLTAIEATV